MLAAAIQEVVTARAILERPFLSRASLGRERGGLGVGAGGWMVKRGRGGGGGGITLGMPAGDSQAPEQVPPKGTILLLTFLLRSRFLQPHQCLKSASERSVPPVHAASQDHESPRWAPERQALHFFPPSRWFHRGLDVPLALILSFVAPCHDPCVAESHCVPIPTLGTRPRAAGQGHVASPLALCTPGGSRGRLRCAGEIPARAGCTGRRIELLGFTIQWEQALPGNF